MNNLVGCELWHDETVVRMFQVLSTGKSGSDTNHLVRNSSSCSDKLYGRSCSEDRIKDGERSQRFGKGVGIQSRSLLAVMDHVNDWQKCNKSRQPICVISKDGCSHSGLYCAIKACCDQVKQEKEVDVFNAVRLVRRHRPQLVPSIEEYCYIYQFMVEFIILSGLKPDPIMSESTICAKPLSSPHHSTVTSNVLTSSSQDGSSPTDSNPLTLHDKSDYSILAADELQTCSGKNYSNYIVHNACYLDNTIKQHSVPPASGSAVPCRLLSRGSGISSLEGELNQGLSHACGLCENMDSRTARSDALDVQFQLVNNEGLSRNTTVANNVLRYSEIVSSALEFPEDFYFTRNNVKHLPYSSSPHVNPSSPRINTPSLPPESAVIVPSLKSLHSPEVNGKVLNHRCIPETNVNQRRINLCKTYSCKSQHNVNTNNMTHIACSNLIRDCETTSLDLSAGTVSSPEVLTSSSKETTMPQSENTEYNNDRSSYPMSTYELLQPGLKTCAKNSISGKIMMLHASYASIDDSLSDCSDQREHHSSFGSIELDQDVTKPKSYAKINFPLSPDRQKVSLPQMLKTEINNHQCLNEVVAAANKPSSTFEIKSKNKSCKLKKDSNKSATKLVHKNIS